MARRLILRIAQAITLIIAAGLLIWMLVASWQTAWSTVVQSGWVAIIGSLGGVLALVLAIIAGGHWLAKQKTSWIMATFAGLTLLKLPLLAVLKITPTADFERYHTLAAFNAQGLTWVDLLHRGDVGIFSAFPHSLNVANFFSFITALAGDNFAVSQLVNIGCTFLDLLLIYWLVARWLSKPLGIMAALTFYALPAYWLYSSLLNGVEPLFLTCILVTMLALSRAFLPLATATRHDQWLNLGLPG